MNNMRFPEGVYSKSGNLLTTVGPKISYWKIRDIIRATAEQVNIILLVPCTVSAVIHVHQKCTQILYLHHTLIED